MAALFRFRATSDKMKIGLPLVRIDRITTKIISGLAKVMDIVVTPGEEAGIPCGIRGVTMGIVEGEQVKEEISLGYLLSHDPFCDRVRAQVDVARAEATKAAAASGKPVEAPAVVLDLGCPAEIRQLKGDVAQEAADLPELVQESEAQTEKLSWIASCSKNLVETLGKLK